MPATTTDKMNRLADMLLDCHSSIVAAYPYTVGSIDLLERPCWLIFHEDASFENLSVNQDHITTSFSVAFVGHPFNMPDYAQISEYEEQAREIYEAAILYLKQNPQLQVTNQTGLYTVLPALSYVLDMSVTGVQGVTLFSREGVASGSFWGFTISMSIKEQYEFEISS